MIYPNVSSKIATDYFKLPPLGLEYLKSNADDLARIEILDARNFNLNFGDIKRFIEDYKPDLVGISCNLTSGVSQVLDLAKFVKETTRNRCDVVLGGWHATLTVDEILSSEYVDAVVRGEGELTFRELIKRGTFTGVLGVSYKSEGKVIHNEDRPLVKDLDGLRFPDRKYRRYKNYNMMGISYDSIETSRGCPYSCDFCCIHEFYRKRWRARSPISIVSELYEIRKMSGVRDILIVDDNFTVDMNRVKDLCKLLIKSRLNFHFICQVRADNIVRNPEVVKLMAEAGFWLVFMGIESISDKGLKDINKKLNVETILKAIKILHENNIVIIGNIILGADLDATEHEIVENIIRAEQFDVDFLFYSILTPFPKTRTYYKCKEEGLLITGDWDRYNVGRPVIRTHAVSPRKLQQLLVFAQNRSFKRRNMLKSVKYILKSRGFIFLLFVSLKLMLFVFKRLKNLIFKVYRTRSSIILERILGPEKKYIKKERIKIEK